MNKFLKTMKIFTQLMNNNLKLKFSNKTLDGRNNSVLNENEVKKEIFSEEFQSILKDYGIIVNDGGGRKLADIALTFKKLKVFNFDVNIKVISQKSANNNLNNSLTLLNLIFFNEPEIIHRKPFYEKMVSNCFSNIENDYGILEIIKETGECFGSTLLTREDLITNPSNGFQCSYNHKKEVPDKTFEEGREFFLNKFIELQLKIVIPVLKFLLSKCPERVINEIGTINGKKLNFF